MKKIFILLVFSLQGVNSIAQSCNAIDLTFGTGGITMGYTFNGNNGGAYSRNILVQPDNKIIQIAGIKEALSVNMFAIIRYKTNGGLDSTFGTNGRVITTVGSSDSYPQAGAIQVDGKIVVTGQAFNANKWAFGLVRYNSDGSLDNSFGTNGKVITPVGSYTDYSSGLAIQSDGKIIVVGSSYDGNYIPAFAVVRYKSNGSVDSTFGNNGKIVSHLGPFITNVNGVYYGTYSDEYARSVVIQADEKIVVAGESYTYTNCYHDDYYGGIYCTRVFAMVRYNSNGSLDNTFGNNGKVIDSVSLRNLSSAVLQTDGKILISGGGYPFGFRANRYKTDGSLDSSFGTNGLLITTVGQNGYTNPNSLVVQPDGKIVLAGSVNGNNTSDFVVVRYNSNGSPDNTFNINGIAVFHTGQQGSYDGATGIAVQNNKIVVGGQSNYYNNNNYNFKLVVVKLDETNYAFSPTIIATGAVNVCLGDTVRLSCSETGSVQWYINGVAINGATNTVYYATTTGSYSVSVNNSNGCGVSAPIVVTVDSPQEPTIIWNGLPSFCEGSSVTISTSSPDKLQWFRNGNPISGATSSTYNVTASGTYVVRATNTAGCSISSSPVVLVAKSITPPTLSWNGPLVFCDGDKVILSTNNPDNHQWYRNGNLINGATGATYTVTTSGSYTESNGCAASAPVIVTVNNIPSKPLLTYDGAPYHFTTTSGYAGYQWYFNIVLIAGASDNTYTPTQTGLYKVQVTDNNGCNNASDVYNLVVLSTADITVGDVKLRFYPNPATAKLFVDIPQSNGKKITSQLYDLNGRLLQKQSLNQRLNEISVVKLPAGLYQLVISIGNEKAVRKVMVLK